VHYRAACIIATVAVLASSATAASATPIVAAPTLVKVSEDPFHNSSSQHKTEVEPATVTFHNTIVSAFQTGRVVDGGGADIGWATSKDAGATWKFGFLPGITKAQNPTNRFDAVSDPSVAYDRKHGIWMISSLPISDSRPSSPAVLISRSANGITWQKPVGIAPRTQSADKNWVTCDNTPTSPYYGHCYNEWDEPAGGDLIMMSKSSDGGLTWTRPLNTANFDAGLGGQPLVQPSGRVIVPILGGDGIIAYQSSDGGHTWSGAVPVATIFWGGDPGGVRASPIPSASMDADGRIYVSWEDCRFRSNCSTNDIVYTTSTDGVNWTTVQRVPIDDTSSSVDHFDRPLRYVDLPARSRIHLIARRRLDLEPGSGTGGTHETDLAAE
jgi:BNR repeat-like domain